MRGKFFFLYAYEICERNSVGKVLLFGHKPFLQVIDSWLAYFLEEQVERTFSECHSAGCKSYLCDSIKDSCGGSGLDTGESSKGSHPFLFFNISGVVLFPFI